MTNYNAWAGFNTAGGISYIIIDGFTIVGDAQAVTASQAQSLVNNTTSLINNGDCISVSGHHLVIRNNAVSYCPGGGIVAVGDYFQ